MIKSILCMILSLLVLECGSVWHIVWEDKFHGNTLDEQRWTYEESCEGSGNWELQCYTARRPQNLRLKGRQLIIYANVEAYNGKNFTSARITSKKAWTYGKFEARAKLPKGKMLWPAIWLLPQNNSYGQWAASGEIDIMESRGERPNKIIGTIHYGGTSPNNIYSSSGEKEFPVDFSANYHKFAVEWNAKEIKWLLDEKEYYSQNINRSMYSGQGTNPYTKSGQPFDQPFHWILNVAVGGVFFPSNVYGPQVTPEEAKQWAKPTMEVDYVRVSQWKD